MKRILATLVHYEGFGVGGADLNIEKQELVSKPKTILTDILN